MPSWLGGRGDIPTCGVGGWWYVKGCVLGAYMGFLPYDLVGTSILDDMGWEGPKYDKDVVLWLEYPTRYFPEEGWP